MVRYKNLCEKYGITEKQISDAIDQIKLGNINCEGIVIAALCDLLISGDIPYGN